LVCPNLHATVFIRSVPIYEERRLQMPSFELLGFRKAGSTARGECASSKGW
jgi:hypothetical protein